MREMAKDTLTEAVDISRLESSCTPDDGADYWINFKMEGKLGDVHFSQGKGDHDIYIQDAPELYVTDIVKLICAIPLHIENLTPETASNLAYQLAELRGQPAKAELYLQLIQNQERFPQYVKALVSRTLEKNCPMNIQDIIIQCDDMARKMLDLDEPSYDF